MDLLERLPEGDKELIHRYIDEYGGGDYDVDYCVIDRNRMDYFLRFWAPAKAPFYKMFGEKFIIKREIVFNKDHDDLEEEMEDALRYKDSTVANFVRAYLNRVECMNLSYEDRYQLKRFARDYPLLVDNIYDGEAFCIPASETIDGHALQINHGCKVVKLFGKIVKAIGHIENAEAGYEAFRRAHSLVLNQKTVRGNLCLSIHPLDFITISDNECGWSSCMSWMEEPGDYRLGTIEMMNSPYIIVAYVEAKNDMCLCGAHWNNKRWRQLIVVTPELILGNKQYPYFNDVVQGTALKWVRELATKANLGYGPYDEESVMIRNHSNNTIGNRKVSILLNFSYMYNDIYDLRMGFIKTNWNGDSIHMNLSGEAVCTSCGEVIHYSDVESSWTTCRECNGMWRCSHCADLYCGEPYYSSDSGECYCEYCYDHYLKECEVCGDKVESATSVYIELIPTEECPEELICYNWTYYVCICDCCMRDPQSYESLFGPLKETVDMWGRQRKVCQLKNITDEGLSRGDLPVDVYNILQSIRDAKSLKERIDLIQKNLY